MIELQKYARALRAHPGVPIAAVLTALGFVSGAMGEHWIFGGMRGAAIMSVFWIPVLVTAWGMRNSA